MLQVPDRKSRALLELASFFESLDPALYDQSTFYNSRTGACCICGWQNTRTGQAVDDWDQASASLGLTPAIAKALFSATGGQKIKRRWLLPDVIEKPTSKEAASCLRHLAITGEIPALW